VAIHSQHILSAKVLGVPQAIYSQGFETLTFGSTNPDGWTNNSGASNCRVTDTTDGPYQHTGTKNLRFDYGASTSNIGVVKRTFTALTVGLSYTFGVWLLGSSTNLYSIGRTGGASTTPTAFGGTSVWVHPTITFTATATSHELYLKVSLPVGSSGTATGFADDFTLVNPPDYILDVKSGTLALDDGWAPYVQGSLVCFAPEQASIELMNPLATGGVRVSVTTTQNFGTGTEWNPVARTAVTRTFNLALRSVEVDHNSGELTMSLESDEALLRDYAKMTSTSERTYGLSVKTAVTYALAKIGAVLEAGAADATLTTKTLDPVYTNLALNPRVGTNTTGWLLAAGGGGGATATRETTGGPSFAPTFHRATITLAAPLPFYNYQHLNINISASTQYNASLWVRSSSAVPVRIYSQPYNSGGTGLTQFFGDTVTLVPNVWTRLDQTFNSDATANRVTVHAQTQGTLPVGSTFDVTAMMVVTGTSPVDYFDGSTVTDAGLFTFAWTGTAHASSSTRTMLPQSDTTIWLPGVSGWDYVSPLVSAGNLRLFCDEARKWYLVSSVVLDGLITLSPATGIERATDTRSLEDASDFYTGVVITYQAPSDPLTGLTPPPSYDIAGSQGSVLAIDRDIANPGPGAAAAILNRAVGKGRVLSVTNESNYDTTPGKALSITLPDTPVQTGSVSSVSWAFPEGRMTVGSKGLTDTPANAWLFALGAWSAATGTWTAATGTN
jgi:hypothetical protein